jgi:hypothetical protein
MRTDAAGARTSVSSCAVGTVLWFVAGFGPGLGLGLIGPPPAFGSIEHVFLFMPLVAAPLALLLLSGLLAVAGSRQPVLHVVAQRVQPIAAAMLLASFCVPKGVLAGGLTAGWLLMTLLLALGGVPRLKPRVGDRLSNLSLLAAHLFLPVGAGWLMLSRLGIGPRSFAELTVFLAALHFHFSGFMLQVLIAATARRLPESSRLGPVQRALAIGAIAGIPLIAAGNAASSPLLKVIGVACMVLSTLGLATTSAAVGLNARSRAPRRMLVVSAASLAAAMALAGVYGIGELTGANWIGIPRMVAIHGLLNALGFTWCGLLGHLLLESQPEQEPV